MKGFSAKYGGQAGVGAAQNMTPVQIERIMKQIADAKQKAADRKKAEEKMKAAIEPLTNDFGRFNNWARRRF
jgi:hypothetical protein